MKYYYQVEGDLRNNIGDVLQGMVAKPFLPDGCLVADRETLALLDPITPSLLIANGWYMHSFDNFPPPDNITPVYLSVHIAQSKLLKSAAVRSHFKKHAPIGCRDDKTLKLFLGWGIPAYYSSCLTTTATARAPINNTGNGEILLVDNVDHPIPDEVKSKLETLLGHKMIRVSHDPPDTQGSFEQYVNNAEAHMESLLKRYCNAALVVTTKIHCALPCLGMGANVMIIHPNPADPRLATVAEFIDILSYEDIIKATDLKRPSVKKEALKARQQFLSNIVNKSITSKNNIVKVSKDPIFSKMRSKANLSALAYSLVINLLVKTGLAGEHIKRVYGN